MKSLLEEGLKRSGLRLGAETCRQLDLFLSEMLRWNQQINLTAIVDPAEATEKHLLDSLLLLPYLEGESSLLDMGSGAGLPGIPLKIAMPSLGVVSVDSVGKKIQFKRHMKRLLTLESFCPCHVLLENLASKIKRTSGFDLVTARAFSSLETIGRLAAPWLNGEGRILAMKGPEGENEARAAEAAMARLGLVVSTVHRYGLPFSGAERQLVVLSKKPV
ncbi:MAG: 16S rRNA (guanine(527)-N(7))-methyltransferase RsmG [Desulfuromonas sp.]|nr:MAG: 16S rRNA (guanine(527)-N(7))-methyltransferase RsmG [Desulfuromonas sp.]